MKNIFYKNNVLLLQENNTFYSCMYTKLELEVFLSPMASVHVLYNARSRSLPTVVHGFLYVYLNVILVWRHNPLILIVTYDKC